MSTVTLTIGPKSYTVTCADGEEGHITALGALVAEKYALIGSARAPLEAQNLLFAALFLADALVEARKARGATPEPAPGPDADLFGGAEQAAVLAERLEALADRAEAEAAALEALAASA